MNATDPDSPWCSVPPWQPIECPASKLPHSADKLMQVIRELDVEHAPRYKAGGGVTWCNIFVQDVVTNMGFEPGHWVRADGNPAPVGRGKEMNANDTVTWLATHGASRGWVEADKKTATDAASRGHLVVVGWHSKGAGPGHVAIMLPEGTIAQAGSRNFVGETVAAGFGKRPTRFFIQVRGGVHTP